MGRQSSQLGNGQFSWQVEVVGLNVWKGVMQARQWVRLLVQAVQAGMGHGVGVQVVGVGERV